MTFNAQSGWQQFSAYENALTAEEREALREAAKTGVHEVEVLITSQVQESGASSTGTVDEIIALRQQLSAAYVDWVVAGAHVMSATGTVLKLGKHVPAAEEKDTVGDIDKKIRRTDPEFANLVENTNGNIVFKDEEGTGADRLMSARMRDGLNRLADFVSKEWPGVSLRVTEAWDENNEHSGKSVHYEGRGADLTTSDKDGAKLGRLAQLAVDAGFDWSFYENSLHVHVSVTKD